MIEVLQRSDFNISNPAAEHILNKGDLYFNHGFIVVKV